MEPKDLLLKNRFGGTVLDSACGSQAGLPVIKAIVQANPSIILERTKPYNHTALTSLWHSHLQSIPGHMQIARILEGDEVTEGHFQRFWDKVEFLACESFKRSGLMPEGEDTMKYILHGLIHLWVPLNALKVAIKRKPELTVQLIKELLVAHPKAAGERNKEGHTPLFIAIRDRMGWDDGLGELVYADVDVLSSTDKETGLFPFLLAASLGGKVAINTAYQLLCAKPHLVKAAVEDV